MRIGKELKQRIIERKDYADILNEEDVIEFEKTGELSRENLGKVMMRDAFTLKVSINSPAQHRTVNLGIKLFKKKLAEDFPHFSKAKFNEAVALYKEKAWLDYADTVNFKGSYPTH